jgi:hypothetical protein
MLSKNNTYIYVAGYDKILTQLDNAFSNIIGSKEKWETRKAELKAGKKWARNHLFKILVMVEVVNKIQNFKANLNIIKFQQIKFKVSIIIPY